jgi:hypothetical protein
MYVYRQALLTVYVHMSVPAKVVTWDGMNIHSRRNTLKSYKNMRENLVDRMKEIEMIKIRIKKVEKKPVGQIYIVKFMCR